MKKLKNITLKKRIIICVFVVIIYTVGFMCLFILKSPPVPEINYGEFPFTLTYEINGEQITVQDVYICELDYCGYDINIGPHRTWKKYVKSTGLENILITEDEERKIFCELGDDWYYMGDFEWTGYDEDYVVKTCFRFDGNNRSA